MTTSPKQRIMIVEDEISTYEKIKNILKNAGYEISGYIPSVREARKEIQNRRPDLVLIDIVLQGEENGHTLAMELKHKYYIPFIYLSRYDDNRNIRAAAKFNPKAFLSKKLMFLLEKIKGQNKERDISRTEIRHDLVADKSLSFGFDEILLQNITLALAEYNRNGILALSDYPENLRQKPEKFRQKLFRFHEVIFLTTNDMEGRTLSENFVRLGLEPEAFWIIKTSLKKIYPVLPPYFQRINRHYIVNLLHPSVRILKHSDKKKTVVLINNTEVQVSSTYYKAFKKKLEDYYVGAQIR